MCSTMEPELSWSDLAFGEVPLERTRGRNSSELMQTHHCAIPEVQSGDTQDGSDLVGVLGVARGHHVAADMYGRLHRDDP